MITLENCQEWFCQQPERLTFIEVNWQDDMRVLCELEKKAKQLESNGIKPLIDIQTVKFTKSKLKMLMVNCIVGFISRKGNNV